MNNINTVIDYINKNKILLIILLFIIYFLYTRSSTDKTGRYTILRSIYESLGLFLTIYSIYNTTKINYANTVNNELTYLHKLFQNITETVNIFFLNNKNMNYYYDEIYNNKINNDESIRDKHLEQIITTNILINIDRKNG